MSKWDDPQRGDPFERFVRAWELGEFDLCDRCPGCGDECEGVCADCADEYGLSEKE